MVREYVISTTHNSSFTLEFATFFYRSYFATQEASVALRVSAIRQVIQINGLTSNSSPITRVRGVQTIVPQYFCLFNTEEKCTLLARGEETTTPQATRH
jgi:hypothetical protein